MSKEMLMPIVRYFILAAGAKAVGSGMATNDDLEAVAGAVAGLVAFGWMLLVKYQDKKAKANDNEQSSR